MSCQNLTFRLGERIGSGAFSHVFEAQEVAAGRLCAVKKSRVSLNICRTLLEYEAQLLKLLEGHQSIPRLLGYGRFEHFEYLAMERLGQTLGDFDNHDRLPIGVIASIGIQMLSALEHIHSQGYVHRDIKPSNIVARNGRDFSHVHLIDFGLARARLPGPPRSHDLVKDRLNIVGTLSWASLNAYNGLDLNPRDDLESLAYVLLFLLRGNLPWHKLCNAGTAVGRIVQIREKMRSWTGARLSQGYPAVFGEILDYARRLDFNEAIDYTRFRAQFELLGACIERPPLVQQVDASRNGHSDCPVVEGQLILAQLDAATSITGYTMKSDASSYCEGLEYQQLGGMPFRPCVVISTSSEKGRHKIQVVPLCTSAIQGAKSISMLSLDSTIPLANSFCYVFPKVIEFHCKPAQEPIPATWKVCQRAVKRLKAEFSQGGPPILDWEKTQDPIPEVRYAARMEFQNLRFYVNLESLVSIPAKVGLPVDWTGTRGWFDESVSIAKRRGWEDGFHWTGDSDAEEDEDAEDSYFGNDHSLWENPQRERDTELDFRQPLLELPRISEIL